MRRRRCVAVAARARRVARVEIVGRPLGTDHRHSCGSSALSAAECARAEDLPPPRRSPPAPARVRPRRFDRRPKPLVAGKDPFERSSQCRFHGLEPGCAAQRETRCRRTQWSTSGARAEISAPSRHYLTARRGAAHHATRPRSTPSRLARHPTTRWSPVPRNAAWSTCRGPARDPSRVPALSRECLAIAEQGDTCPALRLLDRAMYRQWRHSRRQILLEHRLVFRRYLRIGHFHRRNPAQVIDLVGQNRGVG